MVINGSDLYLFIGGVRVAHATSHSIDMKMNTRNTSNKDTGKFNTKGVGRMDITASSDNLLVYTDFATLGAAYLARGVVALTFAEQTGAVLTDGELVGGAVDTSKFYATGNFIITGLTQNAGDEANASYSVSFENADGSFAFHPAGDLTVFAFGINCSANGADDGLVAAFPSGGTAPYTYLWADTVGTTQTVTSLEPGTYTVTVTDDDSATATASVVITEPAGA
jgi:hypothetical protein